MLHVLVKAVWLSFSMPKVCTVVERAASCLFGEAHESQSCAPKIHPNNYCRLQCQFFVCEGCDACGQEAHAAGLVYGERTRKSQNWLATGLFASGLIEPTLVPPMLLNVSLS